MPVTGARRLPVHVEEDHNDVLEHILTAVGSKQLPLTGNTLVHLDSHPDLLLPTDLDADTCRSKRELLAAVSIENWILPCAYLGLINRIVWVRPPWANQIRDGEHNFKIGHAADDGREIRVSCMESYFLSEGVVCAEEELKEAREVQLLVAPMEGDWLQRIAQFADPSPGEGGLILDVDLDFYSTRNPFLDLYERANAYERLKRIYKFTPVPESLQGDERLRFALAAGRERAQLLQTLRSMFVQLAEGSMLQPESEADEDLVEEVRHLKRAIEQSYPGERVDWTLVHDAGCTWDDTELPHHVSSPEEVAGLLADTRRLVAKLPRLPAMVTVARSSLDEFCPPDQVDTIQRGMIGALQELVPEDQLDVHFNYEERQV